ncbi:MAG TPA: peptidylprolyl isomerase, partial [Gemmatimonadaceae bacterium]|nr:peptidylprolyl isomerase [Gemmatimonadaceae bacterium]
QLLAAGDCAPLVAALNDPSAHVRLAAIDALGGPCPNGPAVAAWLERLARAAPAGGAGAARRGASWHVRAHVVVSLARIDAARAAPLVRQDAASAVWQARMYAARAAAVLRDSATLTRLAFDSTGSVREAAIDGLVTVSGRAADPVFARALESADYHVVLAAARALRGTNARDGLVSALLDALDRISTERRETSRDPRLELLARIGELADGRAAARLTAYLRDFDPAVTERAAAILNRIAGGGTRHVAAPERLPVDPRPVEELRLRPATYLRVTMAPVHGGGSFVLRLHPAVAPATVARVVSLVRRGYYNGLTWHRVAPNFVIQGGSPAMNEYVGDGPFLRDELDGPTHARGTVGISTRGRDTGDAQWFVNLVDNVRLDPDYTVFASVESGMEVVDGILEGDQMARVEVVSISR